MSCAKDIAAETDAWGVMIERVFIRNVSLLPEVSRQMFDASHGRLPMLRQLPAPRDARLER